MKKIICIILTVFMSCWLFTACGKTDGPSSEELSLAEEKAVSIFVSRKFTYPEVISKEYNEDDNKYILSVSTEKDELYDIIVDMGSKDENGNYNKIEIEKK